MIFDNFTYDWFDKVILIVEDEPICQLFFRSALRNTEVKLVFASNGEQAVKIIKEVPNIDLVLMDIKLPVMNGFDATMQIKGIRPNLPVIAQTAYALNNEKQMAIEAGCDDYITKPIHIESLLEKIDHVFMTI